MLLVASLDPAGFLDPLSAPALAVVVVLVAACGVTPAHDGLWRLALALG